MCGESGGLVNCVQVYLDGMPGWVQPITSEEDFMDLMLEEVKQSVRDLSHGEAVTFTFKQVEMTQKQLDEAPEFEGW